MSQFVFQYCVNQDASPFRQPTLMRLFGLTPLLLPCAAGEGDHEVVEGALSASRYAAPAQVLRASSPASRGAAGK